MKFSVIYKKDEYTVNLSDKIYIESINIILYIKRLKRGLRRIVFEENANFIIISILWVIWGVGSYYWGNYYKETYTICDLLWDLKNPFFTSVILVLIINMFTNGREHKPKLWKQHDLYVETMGEFETIFYPFLKTEKHQYLVFYNEVCLHDTIAFIKQSKNSNIDKEDIKLAIDMIYVHLKVIEREVGQNQIIGMHRDDLLKRITSLEKKLQSFSYGKLIEEIIGISYDMLDIIADLRRPWRWDIENNIKILEKLDLYQVNGIKQDFYYSMLLNGHKIKILN